MTDLEKLEALQADLRAKINASANVHALHNKAAGYALQADGWIRKGWRENSDFLVQLGIRKLRLAWLWSDEASELEGITESVFPGVHE